MKTIWKYELNTGNVELKEADTILEVPEGSQILHVGLDPNARSCAWFLVDPDKPKVKVTVHTRGTGHNCDDMFDKKFVNTTFQGPFVFHHFVG
jgi:hypothetical protein